MILDIPFDVGDRVIMALPDGYSQDYAIGEIKAFERRPAIFYEKGGFAYRTKNYYKVQLEGGNEFTVPEKEWDCLSPADTD